MKQDKVRFLVFTALSAAVICVISPWSIVLPFSPVPITLSLFAVCLLSCVFGAEIGTLSTVVYIFIGAVGIPVFSGFQGGFSKITGPTGGYIIGYIILAFLCGLTTKDKCSKPIMRALLIMSGLLFDYISGTLWICIQTGTEFFSALSLCVIPFIPFDIIKLAAAYFLAPVIGRQLEKTKILK